MQRAGCEKPDYMQCLFVLKFHTPTDSITDTDICKVGCTIAENIVSSPKYFISLRLYCMSVAVLESYRTEFRT